MFQCLFVPVYKYMVGDLYRDHCPMMIFVSLTNNRRKRYQNRSFWTVGFEFLIFVNSYCFHSTLRDAWTFNHKFLNGFKLLTTRVHVFYILTVRITCRQKWNIFWKITVSMSDFLQKLRCTLESAWIKKKKRVYCGNCKFITRRGNPYKIIRRASIDVTHGGFEFISVVFFFRMTAASHCQCIANRAHLHYRRA